MAGSFDGTARTTELGAQLNSISSSSVLAAGATPVRCAQLSWV